MDILDLRHFSSHQLRPLLERESEVWSRVLAWDYRSSAEMILRYVDAKILPGYAAVDHGRVFGYSFFVYEGSKGVIGDLFVANGNGHRAAASNGGQPVEHRLMTHVIETLQQSPGVHRIEAQLLVHQTGAVSRPFLQEGFHRYARLFMVMPLTEMPEELPLPSDIEVRPWSEQDYQSAAAVITAAYRGHVDSDINDQYRTVTGSLRFLNNIVRFPGCGYFDAESSFVALHRPTRTVVALILCSRVKDDVGHVTQVCVLPDQRGRRIGEGLIGATARELRRRNFSALSLTVTEANTRAVELYRRLGFEIKRIFDAFVWEA
ncbi:MAG TPA: N-acetyltransferase [Burkholderiales bacterium]|jgi:ribosomal protein S18 acetylase RimI-like enzyme|nr:N-acetyltransferase [Burkholderiales bacterium]